MGLSGQRRANGIFRSMASTATILGLLFIVGCGSTTASGGGSRSASTPNAAPATAITTPAAYPASTSQNFMSACEQTSNGDAEYCQCTLSWFQAHVTYTQFLADEDMVRAGQIPADVTNAEDACGE